MIVQIAQPIVVLFALGIVFLAFDVRARDVRDHMFEVVNVRPITNFELVAGRLLGTALPLIIPAVLMVAWIGVHGLLAPVMKWEMGAVVEPVSVLSFLTWGIVPNFLLCGALTMLLSVVLRNRIVIAFTVLGIMAFYSMLHAVMPLYLKTALSTTYTGTTFLASDLAPQFLSWDILLNRTGVVLVATSFLVLAACLYPRLISPVTKPKWLGAGFGIFLLGGLTLGGLGYVKILDLQRFAHWATVHKEHKSQQQTDIDSITGSVEIHPGKNIKLDLKLLMTPQLEKPSEVWLFALNPGYGITQIAVDDDVLGKDDYEFTNGLLRIPTQTMDSGGTVHLVAQGVPDPLFAYLDSTLDWKTMEPTRAKRIAVLGQRPYVFHPQFVALLPGVSWFPTAGAAYGRDIFETHRRDFFYLDLEVSVPDDWLVAGPGTRHPVVGPDNRFRFNPRQPVPEFALITSKFERRAFATRGIEFEILLSPKHTKNLSVLEPAVPALQEWVENQLASLQEAGLNYPFGMLSFVEVPTHLRVYGGGWKMGSAYSPPGVHMIRESGFPIAQFERALIETESYVEANAADNPDDDLSGSFLFDYVKYYFQNDLHGSSPMISLGEQLLGYQATPHGKGATALHAFVNELTSHLALDGAGLFSIYFILDGEIGLQLRSNPNSYFARNFFELILGGEIQRAHVWEPALRTALADLDFEMQPKIASDVILLKIHAISWTVRELVPHKNINTFLTNLVSEYRGGNYSQQDFFQVARDADIDFDRLVGDWLNSSNLPGFLLQEPDPIVKLVPSSKEGEFEYQTSLVLRNNEPVPGAVGFESQLVGERVGSGEGTWSETVHFPANTTLRIALRSTRQLVRVTIHPHLARNRNSYTIWLEEDAGTFISQGTALPYVEKHDWVPVAEESIIVDDLSEGFTIVNGREHHPPPEKPSLFSYFLFSEPDLFNPIMNHGLPSLREAKNFALRGESSLWFREQERTSHGKYYRTHTINFMGGNKAKPQYVAQLPTTGRWKLEFYVPSTRGRQYPLPSSILGINSYTPGWRSLGVHKFEIDVGQTTDTTELDLAEAPVGWNEIGIFETSSQKVTVTLVEVTDGVAIADAIRWTPVE